jgi:hypothetical protein
MKQFTVSFSIDYGKGGGWVADKVWEFHRQSLNFMLQLANILQVLYTSEINESQACYWDNKLAPKYQANV